MRRRELLLRYAGGWQNSNKRVSLNECVDDQCLERNPAIRIRTRQLKDEAYFTHALVLLRCCCCIGTDADFDWSNSDWERIATRKAPSTCSRCLLVVIRRQLTC